LINTNKNNSYVLTELKEDTPVPVDYNKKISPNHTTKLPHKGGLRISSNNKCSLEGVNNLKDVREQHHLENSQKSDQKYMIMGLISPRKQRSVPLLDNNKIKLAKSKESLAEKYRSHDGKQKAEKKISEKRKSENRKSDKRTPLNSPSHALKKPIPTSKLPSSDSLNTLLTFDLTPSLELSLKEEKYCTQETFSGSYRSEETHPQFKLPKFKPKEKKKMRIIL